MIGDRTEACLRSVEGLAQFALPTGIAIAAEGIEPSIFDDRGSDRAGLFGATAAAESAGGGAVKWAIRDWHCN